MYKLLRVILSFSLLMGAMQFNPARAATAGFAIVPTSWRIESYGEKAVVIWYTPSKCANGQVSLPSTATAMEHSRLFATILAAKISQSQVFIYYDDSTPNCTIISYGLN